MLKFFATTISSNEIELEKVKGYELCKDVDAPCDGLRLTLEDACLDEELVGIKAYLNDELVFNGIVDVQRDSINKNGRECFIYSRSSAAILLDNEAEPRCYYAPTAQSLFFCNAKSLGFESKLPSVSTEHSYLVNKGVSCYGAINNFVSGLTGKSIVVTPNNELIVPDGSGTFDVSDFEIINEKRVINRGELITEIDYKIDGDNSYSRHMKSRFVEGRSIRTSKKINLSTLPIWQREYTAKLSLLNALESYYEVEITVDGFAHLNLYDKAIGKTNFENLNGYYINSLCYILDSKGERTRINLNKKFDLKEINYVAE